MQNFLIFMENHWLLTLAFLIIFFLIVIVEFIRTKRSARQISPREAIHFMNHQNAVILDLRSNDAFATGHIVGAVSLPYAELPNKIKKLEKYKSQPIILVCAGGVESSRAAKILANEQFTSHILAGGIRGWRDAEMPLVKD
jgi:rhodanese-related sulfurtransferase